MSDAEVPETVATYLRLRGLEPSRRGAWNKKKRLRDDDEQQAFMPGRDPGSLGDALDNLSKANGWAPQLAREDLVRQWEDVAGAETAQHSSPVSLTDGTLTIQCDSTAWAKNLTYMRAQILTQIVSTYPEAGVTAVRFVGPDVPTWKWGIRSIPGRGPRDTYG